MCCTFILKTNTQKNEFVGHVCENVLNSLGFLSAQKMGEFKINFLCMYLHYYSFIKTKHTFELSKGVYFFGNFALNISLKVFGKKWGLLLRTQFCETLTPTTFVRNRLQGISNRILSQPQCTTLKNITWWFFWELITFPEEERVRGSYITIHNHRIQSKVAAPAPKGGEPLLP